MATTLLDAFRETTKDCR